MDIITHSCKYNKPVAENNLSVNWFIHNNREGNEMKVNGLMWVRPVTEVWPTEGFCVFIYNLRRD